MQNYLLSIKAPYSYLLQIISYNMPSGIVTKLYNNYHINFFAKQIVSREFKSSTYQGNYFMHREF